MTRFTEDMHLVNELGVLAAVAEEAARHHRAQADAQEALARSIRAQAETINAHVLARDYEWKAA